MKEPKCSLCGGPHYKTFCFNAPKKAIPVYKPLKARVKPIEYKPPTYTNKKRKPVKRAKINAQGKSKRSILVREADRLCSIYIRRRYSFNGLARCVTCGAVKPWKEMQNGHFFLRRYTALRWDERNCHVQCPYCNETLGGNMVKYKAYMIERYGSDIIQTFQNIINENRKTSSVDIQAIIDSYKGKLSKL